MALPDLITLQAGALTLRVCPQIGGAVYDFHRDGQTVFRHLPDKAIEHRMARLLGCFPLVPYSNRIAEGRFTWQGRQFQLDHNFPHHPHTMHGVGWQQRWQVQARSETKVTLSLDFDPDEAGLYTWPFKLHAELIYDLQPKRLGISLMVRNDDLNAWPAGLGLHPQFPRTPDMTIQFHAARVWTRTAESLPVQPEAIPPDWCFDPAKPIGSADLDDCYDGWDGHAQLDFPTLGHSVTVQAEPVFDRLVVYTPPDQDFCALEPASHLPDAINRPDDQGLRLLQPGETLGGHVDFHIRPIE